MIDQVSVVPNGTVVSGGPGEGPGGPGPPLFLALTEARRTEIFF